MVRSLSSATLAAVALLVLPTEAGAAESYDNCSGFIDSLPAVITAQGTWCLRSDLSTTLASGAAIEIATNNVTLDCNDFKIGGLGAGADTDAIGVVATARLNATVKRCNIRGFHTGTDLSGSGHLVLDSRFDGNTATGIAVTGTGSEIRNNQVLDTGGSTAASFAQGIRVGDDVSPANGVDVIDNTINGVAPSLANSGGDGIFSQANGAGSIVGNRVTGVLFTGSGTAFGIRNRDDAGAVIARNILVHAGPTGGNVGIECDTDRKATAHANVVQGFPLAFRRCFTTNNTVRN